MMRSTCGVIACRLIALPLVFLPTRVSRAVFDLMLAREPETYVDLPPPCDCGGRWCP